MASDSGLAYALHPESGCIVEFGNRKVLIVERFDRARNLVDGSRDYRKKTFVRHWDAVTRHAGLGAATPLLEEVVKQATAVLQTVARRIPRNFPAAVRDKIFDGVQETAKEIADDL
jgi:hypothetical protein